VVFANGSALPGVGVALLMPLVMALAGAPIADRRLRNAANVTLRLMAAFGVLGARLIDLETNEGVESMPSVVSAGRYTLAVVQHDGGATDEGSTGVDQVCAILPGVMIARSLRHDRGLEQPDIDVLDSSRVLINGEPYTLRPLVPPLC
jgi:hypothetical protein